MVKARQNRDGIWEFTGERNMGGLYSSKKETEFQSQLASVALSLESLEKILIEQGVLREGQLEQEAVKLAQQKMIAVNKLNG